MILVGEDDDGLAAVVFTQLVDGPHDVFVGVVAIAEHVRRRGVAKELFDELSSRHMSILLASHNTSDDLTISGKVRPANDACLAMCDRYGAIVDDEDVSDGFELRYVCIPRPV